MSREVLLSATGLRVRIAGKPVCDALDLQIHSGEVWAMLGENGAGKSTLMATLAGAIAAEHGEIRLLGERLDRYGPLERARLLAWLAQRDEDPFPATVLETVLVGRHPYLGRMQWESAEDEAIACAMLSDVDLEGFAGRDIGTLSGGERRRVALAATLAQKTPVLLLDEPLAQTDVRHQVGLLLLMQRLAHEGRAVLLITHDPNHAVRFASHALLLYGDGRAAVGPVKQVINACALSELYRCQIRELISGDARLFVPEEAALDRAHGTQRQADPGETRCPP